MRIATWNVNSIRARIDRLTGWLDRSDADVLCLQETKVTDAGFPLAALRDRGYEVAYHGLSQWNGVALLSRIGLEDVTLGWPDLPPYGDPPVAEARAITATCGGVRVSSLYVPNGRAVGDPHYHYKLHWLETLRRSEAAALAADPARKAVLCGDFNIAPTDEDVWSVEYFEGKTHVTAPERAAFQALLDIGFVDLVRPHTPGPGVYTYWDYTQLSFQKRRGLRIDFLLGTPALAGHVTGALIDREERKGKGASDHAPVIVDLDLTPARVAPAETPVWSPAPPVTAPVDQPTLLGADETQAALWGTP